MTQVEISSRPNEIATQNCDRSGSAENMDSRTMTNRRFHRSIIERWILMASIVVLFVQLDSSTSLKACALSLLKPSTSFQGTNWRRRFEMDMEKFTSEQQEEVNPQNLFVDAEELAAQETIQYPVKRSQLPQLSSHSFIQQKHAKIDGINGATQASTPNPSKSDHGISMPNIELRKSLKGLQNPRLFGGDILINTSNGKRRRNNLMMKEQRAALINPISLWPNGVIYYELGESVSHLSDLFNKVVQQFHDETCIRFLRRKNNEPDFIRIESIKGCFSYIGRIGGQQLLSLGDGCEHQGTITHELLLAVGFYHHQNRSDRDDYLEIQWDNIAPGKQNQFYKMDPSENRLLNEFDYNSIMLYGPRTFGKSLNKITMKPKREGVVLLEVVEKAGLSKLDIDSINKLYKCSSQGEERGRNDDDS